MTSSKLRIKPLIAAGGAVFALIAAPIIADIAGTSLTATAQAAEEGSGHKGTGAKKGAGGGTKGAGKGKSSDSVFRASPSEDSDRPEWAGVKGGKGGGGVRPPSSGTKKGDLYGDMVVLLRDENGVPILVDGKVQVVAYYYDASGNLVPLTDAAGNLLVIPYDPATGDLVTQMTVDGVTYTVSGGEVELGRLSVSRAPAKVLDHSLDEALSKLTASGVVIGLDSTGRLTVDGVTIDSPLENLALYKLYMTTGSITGVTLPAGFDPASLFAAAADKTGTILVDTVIYLNSIVGINSGTTYYDFSTYNYDRYTEWGSATAEVLVLQPDGSYVPTVVNVYDAVFNSTNWTDTTAGGADDFAAAADDYLQVIEFVHDNEVR